MVRLKLVAAAVLQRSVAASQPRPAVHQSHAAAHQSHAAPLLLLLAPAAAAPPLPQLVLQRKLQSLQPTLQSQQQSDLKTTRCLLITESAASFDSSNGLVLIFQNRPISLYWVNRIWKTTSRFPYGVGNSTKLLPERAFEKRWRCSRVDCICNEIMPDAPAPRCLGGCDRRRSHQCVTRFIFHRIDAGLQSIHCLLITESPEAFDSSNGLVPARDGADVVRRLGARR